MAALLLEGSSDLSVELGIEEIVVRVREAEGCSQQRLGSRTFGRVTVVDFVSSCINKPSRLVLTW